MQSSTRACLSTTQFSWEAALFLAEASKLAYDDPKAVQQRLTEWGFQDAHVFDVDENQGFIATDDQRILIAFRGTDAFADWATNLEVPPCQRAYGEVHKGFYGAYASLESEVIPALDRFDPKSEKDIWITGHSLGGAISAITALELPEHRRIQGIYTFGQPRTGKPDYKETCNNRFGRTFFRIVNNNDVVPKIPPGYCHVGLLIWFDPEGKLAKGREASDEECENAIGRLKEGVHKVREKLRPPAEFPPPRPKSPKEMRAEREELSKHMPSVESHSVDEYIGLIQDHPADVLPSNLDLNDSTKVAPAKSDEPDKKTGSKKGVSAAKVLTVLFCVLLLAMLAWIVWFR